MTLPRERPGLMQLTLSFLQDIARRLFKSAKPTRLRQYMKLFSPVAGEGITTRLSCVVPDE
jgi:hypothetical protein